MTRSIIIIFLFFFEANAQFKDPFLSEKIGECSNEKIDKLVNKEIISNFDATILKAYIVKLIVNKNNIEDYTYLRLLDSLNSFKKGIIKLNNKGSDSVFIRTPYNDKIFIGLSEMSLEKLVDRESKGLSLEYEASLNKFISPDLMASVIVEMKLDPLTSILFGNVFLIKLENGENMSSLKIGNILEIVNRIKKAKEFVHIKKILKL